MPEGVRLSFVGHATFGIDLAGSLLLTDPVLRSRVAFLRWTAPPQRTDPWRGAAAVLISHLHLDHTDLPSLRMLGARTLVVPAGTDSFFRRRGFGDVVPLHVGQACTVGALEVTATAAQHDGRRWPRGLPRDAIGFVVSGGGRRLYFAGDTDLFPEMADIGPDLDIALLPVAGWGRSLGPGHLDPVRAAEATRLMRPAIAVPMHWGSLRPLWQRSPTQQQSSAAASAFAAEVDRRRLPTQVRLLAPGESLTWPD